MLKYLESLDFKDVNFYLTKQDRLLVEQICEIFDGIVPLMIKA